MLTHTGNKIAILGCGRSGVAAARLALASGASAVVVFDTGDMDRTEVAAGGLRTAGVEVVTGPEALWEARQRAKDFDFAVISPGIDLASPLPKAFSNNDIDVIGEVEFVEVLEIDDDLHRRVSLDIDIEDLRLVEVVGHP